MDEAAACDEILLMRDGGILRQTTPDRLRSETGEPELSRAFLKLIEEDLRVSVRVTWTIGKRVLWQIRRDPRTIALLLVVPVFLLVLLKYVFAGAPSTFATIGAPLCGLFPFIVMFLITSIAMLRERTSGTLERQMTLPMSRLDLLAGYAIAFGLLAAVQAIVVCTVGFLALGLDAAHGAWLVALLAIGNALLGMALGLAASAFARTEFQAVQFMPALILPQLILCGLFIERSDMATALYWASWALPLTYSYDAIARATDAAALGGWFALDVTVTILHTMPPSRSGQPPSNAAPEAFPTPDELCSSGAGFFPAFRRCEHSNGMVTLAV